MNKILKNLYLEIEYLEGSVQWNFVSKRDKKIFMDGFNLAMDNVNKTILKEIENSQLHSFPKLKVPKEITLKKRDGTKVTFKRRPYLKKGKDGKYRRVSP